MKKSIAFVMLKMLCVLILLTQYVFANDTSCLSHCKIADFFESSSSFPLPLFPQDTNEFTVTACGEYLLGNEYLYESGDYVRVLTSAQQGDSVVLLHLTILPRTFSDTTVHSCGPYLWCGFQWPQSGEYRMRFTGSNG